MTGVLVSVLLLGAGLLLAGSPGRRLHRLHVLDRLHPRDALHGTGLGDERPRVAGWMRRLHLGRLPLGRLPLGRAAPVAVDPAHTVSELAALARAGIPATQSWRHAARGLPPNDGWTQVLVAADQAARSGGDVPGALRGRAEECRAPRQANAARSLAAAWQVAEQSGAPMARVLERLAESLRAEDDARGARAAAMAGPRATARVLTVLPLGGLLIGQLIGASPISVLVGNPWGRVCAIGGAVLSGAGAWWTGRLVRAAERA